MPNLLKLVTKSVTNFWFGNLCPLINEIKEIIRNIGMKVILMTEWSLGKSLKWYLMQLFVVYHIHFSYDWPHINVFFFAFWFPWLFLLCNMVGFFKQEVSAEASSFQILEHCLSNLCKFTICILEKRKQNIFEIGFEQNQVKSINRLTSVYR